MRIYYGKRDGKYTAEIRIGGRRVAGRSGFLSQGAAEHWVAERVSQADSPPPALRPFRALAQDVLALHGAGLRAATLRGYQDALRLWILPEVGDTPAGEITAGHLARLMARARAAGRSAKTARNLAGVVRLVLRQAVRLGLLPANPLPPDALGRRAEPAKPAQALGLREQGRLAAVLAAQPGDRAAAALALLLATGLRLGELLALTRSDVQASALVVRSGKTARAARKVDLSREGQAALAALLEEAPAAGTLLGPAGVWPHRLRAKLRGACRAAGVAEIRIHDLRHCRATRLLLRGAPALYVSSQLGHANPAFTMSVYGHVLAACEEDREHWANL